MRRVLVVSNARLTVHQACRRRNESGPPQPLSFDRGDEGIAAYERYLGRCPDHVTSVVVDVVEEEFRQETIPHVPAWERGSLMRARAVRAFRETPFVHTALLGREREGRRDDRVLLSAITRPGVLVPWLDSMARHAVPLAGIWSPALLTGKMLNAIGAKGENVLVVSCQSGGGLRQTWFRHGRLRLSRLASLANCADGQRGAQILAEIAHTRRYLGSLDDESGTTTGLEAHVLGHGSMLDELRQAHRGDTGGEFRKDCALVDLAGVARRLGLRTWEGEGTADRLFVHALLARPPSGHYAPPAQTRGFTTMRVRAGLNAAAVALIAGGCVAGGVTAFEGTVARGQARALERQAEVYQSRFRAAQATLPPVPAAPVDLDRAVAAANLLRERRANPVDLLAMIGRALAEFPHVRVERIAWRTNSQSDSFEASEADRFAPGDDGAAVAGGAGMAGGREPEALFQLARVSAGITPFDGDYRAAIDTIHRLVDTLTSSTEPAHVRVLDLPLDLSPGQTLSGDAETAGDAAEFEILVALRVTDSESPEGSSR